MCGTDISSASAFADRGNACRSRRVSAGLLPRYQITGDTMSTTPLRWGITAPGSTAKALAGGVADSRSGELVAIATRDPKRSGLAETFPRARIVDGYGALLQAPDVD